MHKVITLQIRLTAERNRSAIRRLAAEQQRTCMHVHGLACVGTSSLHRIRCIQQEWDCNASEFVNGQRGQTWTVAVMAGVNSSGSEVYSSGSERNPESGSESPRWNGRRMQKREKREAEETAEYIGAAERTSEGRTCSSPT